MAETVFEKDMAGSVPLPMCVVDESGKIVRAEGKVKAADNPADMLAEL